MNLNGGTLQTSAVKFNAGAGDICFNGGLLAASSAATLIAANVPTYVYSNGGTINNNGLGVTIAAALPAPTAAAC